MMAGSKLKIQVLVDNPNSWVIPYAKELVTKLIALGHDTKLIHKHSEVVEGDILCLLSCERVFKGLELNLHNLVVHESDLPQGKGWSPVTWQVLEGKGQIPITLIEATMEVDSGVIYEQAFMELNGSELLTEIKEKQGFLTSELIQNFVQKYPNVEGRSQKGAATFYKKRKPEDSELDINKSIDEQFNLLRVVDNERYPAFFNLKGNKYFVKIHKADS